MAPQYTRYVEKSRKSADVSNMDELVRAVQVYAVDNATDTESAAISSITIQLTKEGVKGATTGSGASATTATIPDDSYLGKAFEASVPNWNKIVRKSTQWGANGGENPTVVLEVTKEGDVKITSRTPEDFEASYGTTTKTTE